VRLIDDDMLVTFISTTEKRKSDMRKDRGN